VAAKAAPGTWLIHYHISHHLINDNVEEQGTVLTVLIDVARSVSHTVFRSLLSDLRHTRSAGLLLAANFRCAFLSARSTTPQRHISYGCDHVDRCFTGVEPSNRSDRMTGDVSATDGSSGCATR